MLTSKRQMNKLRKEVLRSPLKCEFQRNHDNYNDIYNGWLAKASPAEVAFALRIRKFLGIQKEGHR